MIAITIISKKGGTDMQPSTDYTGKYFSILGDSISTLDGYNPPEYAVFYDWAHKCQAGVFSPADTWWGQVIDALGGRLLVNNAFSGSMVARHPDCEIPSYGCSDQRTAGLGIGGIAPDVVMILLGLNDFGGGIPVDPTGAFQGIGSFSIAYATMLDKIRVNYPEAEIWCLTLPWSCWKQEPNFILPVCRAGGHIRQYCQSIQKCGQQAGCKVLDIFCPQEPYDTIDGYHPTAEGMQTIASAVLQALKKNSF